MQISNRALEKIQAVMSEEQISSEFRDLVPVIVWIENRSDVAGDPGPSLIGLMEKDKASKANDFFTNGRITVYNGLPEDHQKKYKQSTLDFLGRNFEFVDIPGVGAR